MLYAKTPTPLPQKEKQTFGPMAYPLHLHTYTIGAHHLWLYVPEIKAVHNGYAAQKIKEAQQPFPYWAQVWPSSIGLARYLAQNKPLIKDKQVLELAAGLGLPSLLAAHYALKVTCTDYVPEAVAAAQQSATKNGLANMECAVMDWNHLPGTFKPDVLLLSDVAYEPAQFEILYTLLQTFLQKGTTIIFSTPQRLMARPFVARLLPWCTRQQQLEVAHHQQTVAITVLVLQAQALL